MRKKRTRKPDDALSKKFARSARFESNEEQLLARYTSADDIVKRLCEVDTDTETYEFLGELFFKFIMAEMEENSPLPERLLFYRNKRFEIMQLYELARAAKLLQRKENEKGS